MICPYRNSTLIIIDTTEEKDGKNIHTHREDYFEAQCKKEDCGAWYNGKCNRRGLYKNIKINQKNRFVRKN